MRRPTHVTKPPGCPDIEALAAYVDGRLHGSDRTRIERHVGGCDECYAIFAGVLRFQQAGEAARAPVGRQGGRHAPPWVSKRLARSASLLAAGAVVVFMVRAQDSAWVSDIVHRFRPAPSRAELTMGNAENGFGEPRFTHAIGEGSPQALRRPREATRGSADVSHPMLPAPEKLVAALEEAAGQTPDSAPVLSDLAAAYLISGKRTERPEHFARALSAAERATQADRSFPQAWFNRALALEALSLAGGVRQAWKDYLQVDARSGWAEEARRRLAALPQSSQARRWEERKSALLQALGRGDQAFVRETARLFPEAAREHVETELLPSWADAVLQHRDGDGHKLLVGARWMADALAEVSGDGLARDAVGRIEAVLPLASADGRQHLASLLRGHRAFREARRLYDDLQVDQSVPYFEDARVQFDRAGSPFSAWARLSLAIAAYHRGQLDGAMADLDRLRSFAGTRGYLNLLGQIHWMRGLIHVVRAEYAESLEDYRTSFAFFEKTGAPESGAAVQSLIAENLDLLGEHGEAWSWRKAALARTELIQSPRRLQSILLSATAASLRQDLLGTALHFQTAALESSREWGKPLTVGEGHLNLARIHSRLGDHQLAFRSFDKAARSLEQISDRTLAARFQAETLAAEGEIAWQSEPRRATGALTRAVDLFRSTGFGFRIAQLYLARGRTHLAGGRDDLAEADFAAGIEAFESHRGRLPGEQLRISYSDEAWGLFTEMIRLQATRRGRPDVALAFAERARARALRESLGRPTRFVDPASIGSQVPAGAALIYYAVLDDRLLSWALTRTGSRFVERPLPAAELARLVTAYRLAIEQEGALQEFRHASTRLYDELIRPLKAALRDHTTLIVIPDGVLNSLSFASLVDRETGRYLVQDAAVGTAPSATLFVQARARLNTLGGMRDSSALVVGNPSFDRSRFPQLRLLPYAEAEAAEVAGLYGRAELVTGRFATKRRFLEAAGRHDVIHFAGHAISNAEFPLLSRLILAPEAASEASGTLFAHELSGRRLPRTRLVVLAACSTGIGAHLHGEGVLSLARPFLAAGVPSVVASLWDVDDRASRELFTRFHRALRQAEDPLRALRQAQLALLADPDPLLRAPASWAAFTSIGGMAQ